MMMKLYRVKFTAIKFNSGPDPYYVVERNASLALHRAIQEFGRPNLEISSVEKLCDVDRFILDAMDEKRKPKDELSQGLDRTD